jgi:hypothetical protein
MGYLQDARDRESHSGNFMAQREKTVGIWLVKMVIRN